MVVIPDVDAAAVALAAAAPAAAAAAAAVAIVAAMPLLSPDMEHRQAATLTTKTHEL